LNFFPLPPGHGSFRPTFGLAAGTDGEVPRSMAATFDSSLRGNPSPPKLIFVTGRADTQRGFHRRGASFSVSPKLLGLVDSPLLLAQVCQPFGKIGAVPNISDGKPLSQELFGPAPNPLIPYA
jgi:hypothetical protein